MSGHPPQAPDRPVWRVYLSNRLPALPVHQCSQSAAFCASYSKAREHRGMETRPQAEQQHNVNGAGTSLLAVKKKQNKTKQTKKERGARHCFGQCRLDERCPENSKGMTFFPFSNPKRRLEDCQGWMRACGRPHHQLLDQLTWSVLARPLPV